MSDTILSQAQQDAFKNFAAEQIGRAGTVVEEMGKLRAQYVNNASTVVDEMARLTKESLAWTSDLFASWQRMTLDATRRATELITK